jgi:hypothetical protein
MLIYVTQKCYTCNVGDTVLSTKYILKLSWAGILYWSNAML